jgi:fructosamine-3-kinase
VSLPAGATLVGRVGGGYINEGFRVTLADGQDAFVKTRADVAPGEYEAEAAGLQWLAAPRALRTPRVLELGADRLALEWVEPGALSDAGAEELGRGLAHTHEAGAPAFGAFAAQVRDVRLGPLELSNEPCEDWPSFYARRRLQPLARLALDRGVLSVEAANAVERVCERLGELCGEPEPPARLHGDLWSGNTMADRDGRPWLIDPSAYAGHREVDLAMLALFGAPSQRRVFDAYEEASPLADGWRERVELYQLLPLLQHALLFGGSYPAAAARIAARYAAPG